MECAPMGRIRPGRVGVGLGGDSGGVRRESWWAERAMRLDFGWRKGVLFGVVWDGTHRPLEPHHL